MADKKTTTGKKTGKKNPPVKPATKKSRKKAVRNHGKQARKGNNSGHNAERGNQARITLDESLTIATAEKLKEMFDEYAGIYKTIELDGSSVELIDTAALQILTSFIRQSGRESVEIRWLGKSDVLEKTAALLGLTGHLKM